MSIASCQFKALSLDVAVADAPLLERRMLAEAGVSGIRLGVANVVDCALSSWDSTCSEGVSCSAVVPGLIVEEDAMGVEASAVVPSSNTSSSSFNAAPAISTLCSSRGGDKRGFFEGPSFARLARFSAAFDMVSFELESSVVAPRLGQGDEEEASVFNLYLVVGRW